MLRKFIKNRMFVSRRWFSESTEVVQQKPVFNADAINPEDYRDLDQKVKFKTGYALMEVEPFPRFKIMEIGLALLRKIRQELPETAYCRMFLEERVKYIMEITHETPNIQLLEKKLGIDCIELFIETFAEEYYGIDDLKHAKPWIDTNTPEDIAMYEMLKVPYDQHMRFESLPSGQKPQLLRK